MLGVVSQTRVYGGNRIHDPHANSLALDYQGTHVCIVLSNIKREFEKIFSSVFLTFSKKRKVFGGPYRLKTRDKVLR